MDEGIDTVMTFHVYTFRIRIISINPGHRAHEPVTLADRISRRQYWAARRRLQREGKWEPGKYKRQRTGDGPGTSADSAPGPSAVSQVPAQEGTSTAQASSSSIGQGN